MVTEQHLRVGVIGTGTMGKNHVRVYTLIREAELVAVADPDPRSREEVAARYNIPAYRDHREILDKVDAVSIAVPTAQHRAIALDCLEAGVHVLVEKPIASTSAEGREMVAAAKVAGRVLQVGHVERFNPAVMELVRVLEGERVVAIDARRLSPVTPRVTDIDVVFDLMVHDIDIALSIAGGPMAKLSAVGRPVPPAPLDHVVAHGRTTSGVIVRFAASKITQETVRQLEVTTERAYITVNYLTKDIIVHRSAAISVTRGDGYSYVEEGSFSRPHLAAIEPLRSEIEHFLGCVRSGATPLTSGESAIAALEVAERVQRSASGDPTPAT